MFNPRFSSTRNHRPGRADCTEKGNGLDMKHLGRVLTMIALALLGIGAHAAAAQESVLWSFNYPPYPQGHDGINPLASLIFDTAGNLYGTTEYGGTGGSGTVFELSPGTGGIWTEKVLWSFGGAGGDGPFGSLIFDTAGNLYGTTTLGGANLDGTVFELSPGTGGVWTEKVLWSFGATSTDGVGPQAGLIFDSDGNLYGTTLNGGANHAGIVFELSPGTGGVWTEKILCNFATSTGGSSGGLIFDAQGNLYGTTGGTVFELSSGTGGVWTEKLLWTFAGYPTDGSGPMGGLIFDSEGNLYGTTKSGGSGRDSEYIGLGTVFELSPEGSGSWTEKVLWNFQGEPTDGTSPMAGLILDAQGNLYSTTVYGGPNDPGVLGRNLGGTVFELTPESGGAWTENILHNFTATSTDGTSPQAGLVADTAGNLYGTTYYGGANDNDGTVFEIAAAGLPTFLPPAGAYSVTQSVTISSATTGATIYYTTDGTTPTTSSTKYTGAISVSATETIKAFAVAAGYPNSAVASAAYTIQPKTTPKVTVTPGSSSITTTQVLLVTVAVAGTPAPTGTVILSSGTYASAATSLSSGSTQINIPAGSLAVGNDTLTATYTPDSNSSSIYSTATGTSPLTVTKTTPTVTVTPASSSITATEALSVTVAVSGTPAPTGTVILSSGTYASAATSLSSGSTQINIPAGSLAVGNDMLTANYSGDNNYNTAAGTAPVTVTTAVNPSFAITGTSVTVSPGATTGNTSTISLTPAGGFTGSVALTAAITSSPSGAQYLPTLSFGSTSPVSIAGTTAGTATLTINTTAPTSATLVHPKVPGVPWYAVGGATLACILWLGIPATRRRWQTMLGMLAIVVALAGGFIACSSGGGGGTGGGGGGGGTSNPGTTAGSYTITVTGTSGAVTETGTVTLSVQ